MTRIDMHGRQFGLLEMQVLHPQLFLMNVLFGNRKNIASFCHPLKYICNQSMTLAYIFFTIVPVSTFNMASVDL